MRGPLVSTPTITECKLICIKYKDVCVCVCLCFFVCVRACVCVCVFGSALRRLAVDGVTSSLTKRG